VRTEQTFEKAAKKLARQQDEATAYRISPNIFCNIHKQTGYYKKVISY